MQDIRSGNRKNITLASLSRILKSLGRPRGGAGRQTVRATETIEEKSLQIPSFPSTLAEGLTRFKPTKNYATSVDAA
jgi:hypothetical protein